MNTPSPGDRRAQHPKDAATAASQSAIAETLAPWVATRLGAPPATARTAVIALLDEEPPAPPFDRVLRVELALTLIAADEVRGCITVAIDAGAEAIIAVLERVFRWDELPSNMREALIRQADQEQTFLLVDRRAQGGAS